MSNAAILLFIELIFIILWNLADLWRNNEDCCFSEETLKKLTVKEKSFLRKIIPFKEGYVRDKKGHIYGYRYCLYTNAIRYFASLILFLVITPILIVNLFYNFIPQVVLIICIGSILIAHLFIKLIIVFCSRGLHL